MSVVVRSAGLCRTLMEPFNKVPVCIPVGKASQSAFKGAGDPAVMSAALGMPQDVMSPLEWSWPSVRVALTHARFNLWLAARPVLF